MNKAAFLKLCRLSCLLGFIVTTGAANAAPETKLELLETKTGVYSNVTVTSKTDQYVVILHSRGIGTIKVVDLSNEAQTQLGYVPAESANEKNRAKIFARAKESLNAIPNANELLDKLKTKSPSVLSFENISSTVLFAILGVSLLLYIVFCHCASVICQKTGNKPGLLIWLPILQMIPLYRAAGMSPIWAFVPLLNVFAQIVWSFKIAKARGKGALTGLLLLLPVTSPLAFLYLAMSGEMPTEEKPKKFTATGLTFDTVQ